MPSREKRGGVVRYDAIMSSPIRVIGRIDLAEKIGESLRSAGFDAEVVTAGPTNVYAIAPVPAEGVDVAVATSIFDPTLWSLAKRRHPARPMVAVSGPERERALRGSVARRFGADAYVTWPATPEQLTSAVRRAESAVTRRRSFGRADLATALLWFGLAAAQIPARADPSPADVLRMAGALLAGVGFLLGVPYAWNVRWHATAGVAFTFFGALGVALAMLRLFR
jgi:hypothetical protein